MSNPETDKPASRLGRIAQELVHACKVAISLLALVSILVLLGAFYKEINSTALVVESIPVPKSLEDKGLSPKMLAARVASRMAYMDRNALSVMPRQFNVDNVNRPEIQMPVQDSGFRSATRFLKDVFGKKDVAIIADVIESGSGEHVARVRVEGGEYSGQQYTVSLGADPDVYSDRIAEAALHAALPDVLAVYLAGDEEKKCKGEACSYAGPLAIFDELLANNNKQDDKWALLGKGYYLTRMKKYNEARESYDVLLQVDPNSALAGSKQGSALPDQKKPEEAIDKQGMAISLEPKAAFAGNSPGALPDLKKPEDATEEYRKAIALDPNDAAAYNNWGNALSDLQKPEEAIEKYRKAIAIDPKFAVAYKNWGNALSGLKKPAEAIEKYRKAIALDPNYAVAYNNWGNALSDLKKPEEAIEKYRKAIALDPNYAVAYNNWGNTLSGLKKPEEAIEKYRKAIAIDPNDAFAYNNWGNALSDLKKPEEAIEKYRKAISIDPNFASAHHILGIVLERLGRTKEAEEQFRKYKELEGKQNI
ncbi:MAG: tetratricopeptide repeat protein [Nitrosomonadales bacterium]|nr:tetratricopeptide repeat protein [Nitrosomonadales bacterium]